MGEPLKVDKSLLEKLSEVAKRLGVSPWELASAAIRDLLAHREADFTEVAQRVLKKNRDLYRRLT